MSDEVEVRTLLARLGAALVAAGQPVNEVEADLQEVGTALGFPFGLAFHQHADAGLQAGDLAPLRRDDIRQILDHARQMRDAFFQRLQLVHSVHLR